MRSLKGLTVLAAAGAVALAGCGGGSGSADGGSTITVGASPTPHAQILQYVQENLAEEAGIKIEIVEYDDYVQPNEALAAGDLDANYFQTIPYLETESEARGYDFVAGEGIHLEPLAAYSEKITTLDELPDGAIIGIINDPTNQERGLELLAAHSLVELPTEGDVNVNTVTKLRNFEFEEIDGPKLGRSLADVDLAVINGNNAQMAGLSPVDSVILESTEGNPSLNVLVWSADTDKAAAIAKLNDILTGPEVAKFIQSQWADGSVLPALEVE